MLCLSGFELYPRWVRLFGDLRCAHFTAFFLELLFFDVL